MGATQQVLSSYGAAFVGPLDDYTAGLTLACSVWRRLLTSYTGPLITVRSTAVGDPEQDIYPDANGLLDTAALSSFVGSDSGYVTKIYEQVNGALYFHQTSASAQRRIVNAGTLDTLGSTPCMVATGDNSQGYFTPTMSAYTGTTFSAFVHGSLANSSSYNRFVSASKDAGVDFGASGIAAITRSFIDPILTAEAGGALGAVAVAYNTAFTASSILDGTNHTMRSAALSDAVAFSGSLDINRFLLGMVSSASFAGGTGDKWCEGLVYLADKTADDTAIRTLMTP